jgi:hypothetical protein
MDGSRMDTPASCKCLAAVAMQCAMRARLLPSTWARGALFFGRVGASASACELGIPKCCAEDVPLPNGDRTTAHALRVATCLQILAWSRAYVGPV